MTYMWLLRRPLDVLRPLNSLIQLNLLIHSAPLYAQLSTGKSDLLWSKNGRQAQFYLTLKINFIQQHQQLAIAFANFFLTRFFHIICPQPCINLWITCGYSVHFWAYFLDKSECADISYWHLVQKFRGNPACHIFQKRLQAVDNMHTSAETITFHRMTCMPRHPFGSSQHAKDRANACDTTPNCHR